MTQGVARVSKPARRAVSGYLPYFHRVESRGIEPRFPPRQGGVFPLDHDPVSGAPGKRTPITWVQAKCLPVRPASRVLKRSVRESNPVSVLTMDVCYRNTYRPFRKSDPRWNRTITLLHVTQASSPLDHGITLSVTRVGVEPTKSPRSGHRRAALVGDRFACLRTRPCKKWRVRGSHPAVGTYEAPLGAGPPASCRSRYRAGLTGLMKASWAPAASAIK